MANPVKIKTALLSVADKTDLEKIAQFLHGYNIQLFATGGTAEYLSALDIPINVLESLTGFRSLLGGRVKTLHPYIHAGILADRSKKDHREQLEKLNIPFFDLVIINFYPFESFFRSTACESRSDSDAIEVIDIGGPALLRAAAKNYRWVTPISSPQHYPLLIEEMQQQNGQTTEQFRKRMAWESFRYSAYYDALIAEYFAADSAAELNSRMCFPLIKETTLRYGENPHQKAGFYKKQYSPPFVHKIHGKELSYNNLLDVDAAIRLIVEFTQPTVAILKHTNPCGVASDVNILTAYHHAFETDPISPFGGVVVSNQPVSEDFAAALNEIFLEIIIAPDFTENALAILKKKKNRRLLRCDFDAAKKSLMKNLEFRSALDGILLQEPDLLLWNPDTLQVVTHRHPTEEEWEAMAFCWKVVKHAKSNAIVVGIKDRTLSIGAGQPSRVDAVAFALEKAQRFQHNLQNTILASDAFFPFPDSVELAAKAGISAIVQPGGSIRDDEVIAAANSNNIAMVFTGIRHFKH